MAKSEESARGIRVPKTDSLQDDPHKAQGQTDHAFAEPYSRGPEHHPDGAVDPALPGKEELDFNSPAFKAEMDVVRHEVKPPVSGAKRLLPAPIE